MSSSTMLSHTPSFHVRVSLWPMCWPNINMLIPSFTNSKRKTTLSQLVDKKQVLDGGYCVWWKTVSFDAIYLPSPHMPPLVDGAKYIFYINNFPRHPPPPPITTHTSRISFATYADRNTFATYTNRITFATHSSVNISIPFTSTIPTYVTWTQVRVSYTGVYPRIRYINFGSLGYADTILILDMVWGYGISILKYT